MDDRDKYEEVPFFIHEATCDKLQRMSDNAMEKLVESTKSSIEANKETIKKMEGNNKRMLIALIVVCVTLVITALAYLSAYKDLNIRWMTYLRGYIEDGVVEEELIENGDIFVQGDAVSDQESFEG